MVTTNAQSTTDGFFGEVLGGMGSSQSGTYSAVISVPQKSLLNEKSLGQAAEDLSALAHESDVLLQLRRNISQLEDLHGRLKFMMGELGYLLRK